MQQLIESGDHKHITDPTPDRLYVKKKLAAAGKTVPPNPAQASDDVLEYRLPKNGWTKDLVDLPKFSDINIEQYTLQSGKKVDRKASEAKSEVCMKTCIKIETRGYQFFAEGYIHDYCIKMTPTAIFIKAKCFPSQRKNEKAHQCWCVLSRSGTVLHAYCTCVAGASGFCNHVCALLYQTSHFSKRGMEKVPPDGSKTSVPQTWDKPRVHGIRPEPVMACSVKKAKVDGDQSSKPIKSSLYEARMENVVPNDPDLLEEVQKSHPHYGLLEIKCMCIYSPEHHSFGSCKE